MHTTLAAGTMPRGGVCSWGAASPPSGRLDLDARATWEEGSCPEARSEGLTALNKALAYPTHLGHGPLTTYVRNPFLHQSLNLKLDSRYKTLHLKMTILLDLEFCQELFILKMSYNQPK